MISFERPTLKIKSLSKDFGEFYFGRLPVGMGNSIGNALRRTALMYVPAYAPVELREMNCTHKFQAIDGVKEEMLFISHNASKILIKVDLDKIPEQDRENIQLELRVPKDYFGVVRFGNISTPNGVEILNKDVPFFEIIGDLKTEINMVINCKKGLYFQHSDKSDKVGKIQQGNHANQWIPLTSVFSPVVKFMYNVLDNVPSQNEETIEIKIKTDGRMCPKDVLVIASEIMTNYFIGVSMFDTLETVQTEETNPEFTSGVKEKDYALEEFDLSTEEYNRLKDLGMNMKSDILSSKSLTPEERDKIIRMLENTDIRFEKQ